MTNKLTENTLIEQPALGWLRELGYEVAFGPDIGPGGPYQERDDWRWVVLTHRLSRSLRRLNPSVPEEAIESAMRELTRVADEPQLMQANKKLYELTTRGVSVSFRNAEGREETKLLEVFDFEEPANNEFLAVNQFSIQGAEGVRRPDLVVFVNGLPLAVFEFKSPLDVHATEDSAISQLETYKKAIPALFAYNQVLAVSDGNTFSKHGTISSTREWFSEWRYIDEEEETPRDATLEVLIRGMFQKERFLDIVQNFIVYEADSVEDATTYTKKMCRYHQFYGVRNAIEQARKAARQKRGKRKIGTFWHTQGAGKTLSMVFFVNKLRRVEELKSPTVLFLTDREDLDHQLHKTFARGGYATAAKRMESIEELKDKLKNPGAEIIFTTIQKFDTHQELLSENENIVVVADEAHRSQYARFAGNVRDALPGAAFMGITGTPVSFDDRDTRMVFGDFVSVYQINQAEEDRATVPIYYEGRMVPLALSGGELDEEFKALLAKELTPEEEQKLKQKFSRLDAAVGAPERLDKVAADIVSHFNNRGLKGKGMVVAINRRVAVELYQRIIKESNAPEAAVVISNPEEFAESIQSEHSAKELEKRFKNPDDPLQLAIVCGMWITGFDVPPLHTMYIDTPLKRHTLMQAIARVNRIYKDKPAGLIVDYIGVASQLKESLKLYSSDIKQAGIFPFEEAIEKMQEKYESVKEFFEGVEYAGWKKKSAELPELLRTAAAAVLGENAEQIDHERTDRFLSECTQLFKLHALVMPHNEANAIREDVEFFRAVQRFVQKYIQPTPSAGPVEKDTETAIRELLSGAIAAEGVVDLFGAQGKEKPEISIFDERFLEEVKKMRFKNLAIEVLRKLLNDEIRVRRKKNVVKYKQMQELLEELIEKYENNIISSSQIIEQLIELSRNIKLQDEIGIKSGLSREEMAFYDALAEGKKSLKDEERKRIVKEIVKVLRRDVTVDWTNNDQIKARIRANVRRILLGSGFSQDEARAALENIFEQANALGDELLEWKIGAK